jgi:hypothetical protein
MDQFETKNEFWLLYPKRTRGKQDSSDSQKIRILIPAEGFPGMRVAYIFQLTNRLTGYGMFHNI